MFTTGNGKPTTLTTRNTHHLQSSGLIGLTRNENVRRKKAHVQIHQTQRTESMHLIIVLIFVAIFLICLDARSPHA